MGYQVLLCRQMQMTNIKVVFARVSGRAGAGEEGQGVHGDRLQQAAEVSSPRRSLQHLG